MIRKQDDHVTVSNSPYPDLDQLADAGRWETLFQVAAAETASDDDRLEAAHLLALEGPAQFAVAATELFPAYDGSPGPLWEVMAHRPWRDLEPYLTNPRTRLLVAHTRVLHGEDLRGAPRLPATAAPLCLQPWEAARWEGDWHMPEYLRGGSIGSTIWACPPALTDPADLPPSEVAPAHHDAVPILNELSSHVQASAFHGTAWEAAAMVATPREKCVAWQFPFADAYADLLHLATGKGAYVWGAGCALGRIALWKALTAMAGLPADVDPQLVNAFVERLRVVGWREKSEPLYHIHLALEDHEQGVTWVLDGHSHD